LVLTFCCAGTPSTGASADLLREHQVDLQRIQSLNYRGFGWPGGFASTDETGNLTQHLGYLDSWHILQKKRPFRCKLCPDGLGELADISCGDAWHRYDKEKENPGLSIAMVRTSRGRELLKKALDAEFVTLEPSSAENALRAQGLTERRKEIFGRKAAMYLLGVPATQFKGFNLFRAWLGAPSMSKIKSVVGTARRLIQRGMFKRIK
jgi:coenzyme F420 hydrogenase subunit beta